MSDLQQKCILGLSTRVHDLPLADLHHLLDPPGGWNDQRQDWRQGLNGGSDLNIHQGCGGNRKILRRKCAHRAVPATANQENKET